MSPPACHARLQIEAGTDAMTSISHLFIAPTRGAPSVQLQRVKAVRHSGIVGDRWYRSRWIYPLRLINAWRKGKRCAVTSVSILSMDDLSLANDHMEQHLGLDFRFSPMEMRRNIVLDGPCDLNSLIGREFSIGGVRFRGAHLCTPCSLPPKRSGRLAGNPKQFIRAFMTPHNRGGIRAQILTTGMLSVGDLFVI